MNTQGNHRWLVQIALAIGLLAVGLDLTILNLALPTLAIDLHATNRDLQWFADAYTLVFAAALLPAGLLGDRFGRKKVLIFGLILFGVASLACAYASTAVELIVGRVFLGLGAAFLVPLSMSIIPVLFTEDERPKAIGIWVMSNAIGIPLGPIVGGWLLNNYSWGSVFFINVPLILIALFAVFVLLPESQSVVKPRVDFIGVLSSSLGLVGITYGVIEVGEKGWDDITAVATIVIGVLLLVVFVFWEQRTKHPLVDPFLFRSSSFTWGSIMATIVSFLMFGLLFVMPQYFQAVKGADALGAGLRLLPLVGGLLVGSQISDKLQRRIGGKITIALGFLLLALAFMFGANTNIGNGYGYTSLWITIVGLGIGFVLPASMDVAMSALTAERSGVGSALIMAMRNIGGTMGVAILGTILSSKYRDKLDLNEFPSSVAKSVQRSITAGTQAASQLNSTQLLKSVHSAFIYGMDVILYVCGGVATLGIVLTLAFLKLRVSENKKLEFKQNTSGK
ncbi:DHA2 family efflux MFS transporter permease subunit [Lysinibacillus agricola]|uniref:DHA2 family efflux MFS transporter permease subunit n=1 Tax=Lysinibacillus agricola TaxID=2590012 RepID=A0ABX7AKZ1_9BACI|nr:MULTISPECIES: DHA2 family efflux MFS transporter permease subunit [Lysinibacillus]KOS62258.1 multidrug MFS transporter [Lysinibacillus sp. FJAT-14222]QQP10513.1 DHA2 family efflux MFS transporter permease subunit [Lysinibacillus agricola]